MDRVFVHEFYQLIMSLLMPRIPSVFYKDDSGKKIEIFPAKKGITVGSRGAERKNKKSSMSSHEQILMLARVAGYLTLSVCFLCRMFSTWCPPFCCEGGGVGKRRRLSSEIHSRTTKRKRKKNQCFLITLY